MLSKLLGKSSKTTQQSQQVPIITAQGKTASGQKVVIVEDSGAFKNVRDKLAQDEQRRQQLDREIAEAQREQLEAQPNAARHQFNADQHQDNIEACAAIAITAISQGVFEARYCEDGRIQAVKSSAEIPSLLRKGFVLRNIEGRFFLGRGLLGGAPLAELENKLANKPPKQKSVFISYQWSQKEIAIDIQREFEKKGFLVIRDEDNLAHGVYLPGFMKLITHPNMDYMIAIVSQSYLKSKNCMYEVNQMMSRYNFVDTLLPYVLTDDPATKAGLYDGSQAYLQHWQGKLEDAQRLGDSADIDVIQQILKNFRKFTETVRTRINVPEAQLKSERYQAFFAMIEEKEKEKEGSKFKEAESLFRQAISYQKMEEIENAEKCFVEAIESVKEALHLDGHEDLCVRIYNAYGIFLQGQKRDEEAQKQLRIASKFGYRGEDLNTLSPATNLVQTERPTLTFEYLNRRNLTQEYTIIAILAERVTLERSLVSELFEFIERSKSDPAAATAAANAMTILVAAQVNLSKCDFQGVRIAGANLSHGTFTRVNFAHADLRNVQLHQAKLDYSTMAYSQTEGLDLGRYPAINLPFNARCLAVSFDGKWVVSANEDRTVRTWDSAGEEQFCFTGHTDFVDSVALSPDGRWAVSGSKDKTVRLWDCQTGREVFCFNGHTDQVTGVAISSDGKWVASGSYDKTVRVWDCQTGKEACCFVGHSDEVTCVAISSDGRWAVSGSRDRTVCLWDCQSGQWYDYFNWFSKSVSFLGHSDAVSGVALSPDSKWVLSTGADKTTRLWNCTTGKEDYCFNADHDTVPSLSFSHDGKSAFSWGCQNREMRILDCTTGKVCVRYRDRYSAGIMAFSYDGQWTVSSSYRLIERIRNVSVEEIYKLKNQQASLRYDFHDMDIAFSDDKWVLSGGWDKTVRLWNCETGKEQKSFTLDGSAVEFVALSPDGKSALSSGHGATVILWECESGKVRFRFNEGGCAVRSVAFSFDGKRALLGDANGTVLLFDCENGQERIRFIGQKSAVWSVAFSPDGRSVVSGSADRTARVWDCQTGKERFCIRQGGTVDSVAFSPDGQFILSQSDTCIYLTDSKTGIERYKLDEKQFSGACFSPKGKWILCYHKQDPAVELWDPQSGQQPYRLLLSGWKDIVSAKFHSDGKRIIIVTYPGALHMWELFDESNCFRPALKWSTVASTLSAEKLNMKGVKGLSVANHKLLKQLGATEEDPPITIVNNSVEAKAMKTGCVIN